MYYFKLSSEAKVRPIYYLKKKNIWFLKLPIWATEPWWLQLKTFGNSFQTISHFILNFFITSLLGLLQNFFQNTKSFLVSMFGTLLLNCFIVKARLCYFLSNFYFFIKWWPLKNYEKCLFHRKKLFSLIKYL